ncbi:MAG: U32 family peptidase C-terminal domain-containing protein, partial [Clostridia bacterium]|nr:U32 family peptidase C-terminal domain-containing protein [Clostridia bacterium]
GDMLEVLSPSTSFNQIITVDRMETLSGEVITDAKLVQQKIRLYTSVPLYAGDMLRIKV